MLAETPLVKNLDNPDYMKILLDGKANLEQLFAELGAAPLAGVDKLQADTDRTLPGFRALMKLPTLPDQILRTLRKPMMMGKSN
jgi:hypothetical protein